MLEFHDSDIIAFSILCYAVQVNQFINFVSWLNKVNSSFAELMYICNESIYQLLTSLIQLNEAAIINPNTCLLTAHMRQNQNRHNVHHEQDNYGIE